MAEPYKKVGRGGAGNFYSKKDIEVVSKAVATTDPESQPFPTHTLARALSSSQPAPEYLHTGRGGAGNWIKPTDLESQGLTQSSPTSVSPTSISTTSPPTSSSSSSSSSSSIPNGKRVLGGAKPTYRGGRGGAGNYTNFEEEERLRREEEERTRAEMEGRVVRDVEAGLARPEQAYGGFGGSWEMGVMK